MERARGVANTERGMRTATTVGAVTMLAVALLSLPNKIRASHFPPGSHIERVSDKNRRAGVVSAAEVPPQLVGQVECGGDRAPVIHILEVNYQAVIEPHGDMDQVQCVVPE